MVTSADVSTGIAKPIVVYLEMLFICVTTITSFVACTATESNESQETCVDCAPSSQGRYLSAERCVGESADDYCFNVK